MGGLAVERLASRRAGRRLDGGARRTWPGSSPSATRPRWPAPCRACPATCWSAATTSSASRSASGDRDGGATRPREGRRLRPQQPTAPPCARSDAPGRSGGAARVRRPQQAGRLHEGWPEGARQPGIRDHVGPSPLESVPVYEEVIGSREEHELLFELNCLRPGRAEANVLLGDWDAATPTSSRCSMIRRVAPQPGHRAALLGRVRARAVTPARSRRWSRRYAGPPLRRGAVTVPLRTSRSEAAWLAGDSTAPPRRSKRAPPHLPPRRLRDARRHAVRHPRRRGVEPAGRADDEPLRLYLDGDSRGLADFWEERGCRYEPPTRWSTATTSTTSAAAASSSRSSALSPVPRWRRGGSARWAPATCPGDRGPPPGPTPPASPPARSRWPRSSPRAHQRGDRRAADPLAEDRRPPRVGGAHQARRVEPPSGGRAAADLGVDLATSASR